MVYAIISDIHANLIALSATLKDAQLCGANKVLCLGDVVGYGPEPEAVVNKIRNSSSIVLAGNHDDAVSGRLHVSDFIDIVDDDVQVDDKLLITTEDDANLGVEIKEYVPQQEVEEEVEEEVIPLAIVEEKPKFMGGDQSDFTKWVFKNIVYPEIAKENGVQSRVTLQFTVETDGRVSNVVVVRGVDSSLDKEAVRVVQSSPKWTPGKQRNKPVRVRFTFPVIFQLR
jgi:TonB family protein